MASEIRITLDIGAGNELSIAVPLGGTRAQIGAALTRYMLSFGQVANGTQSDKIVQFLTFLKGQIRNRSRAEQQKELEQANMTTIQATLDSDNAL